MLQFGDFSAWITVDDLHLPQYSVQHTTDQVTCWIPSQTDKKFTVYWKDPHGSVSSAGYLSVDGVACGAKHLYARDHPHNIPGRRVEVVQKGTVATSTTTERPLSFTRLELTDDDMYLNVPTSPELGDIKLEIFQVKVEGRGHFSASYAPPITQKIHERSKKAVGHRIKLGDEVACREKKFVTITKLRLLVTFIFRYRPLELLQANGIAPIDNKVSQKRTATTPASSDIIDLTVDEAEIKQERSTKRIKTEVKVEPDKPWPRSLGMKQLGDILDLTV